MCQGNVAQELIAKATGGDRLALEQLLLEHYARLSHHIAVRLEGPLRRLVSLEDILQETFIQAIRDIQKCESRSPASFSGWLNAIAENRLRDTRKGLKRKRRGGGRRHVRRPSGGQPSTMAELVELIADPGDTPSRPAARREAVQAMQVALAGLPSSQREAIDLRYLAGKSVGQTAAAMDRSPAAVRGLIHRAKQALRDALGRSSLWFSKK